MISLYDLLEASNSQLFGEPAAQLFTAFSFDSHQPQESQLYVALTTDYGDTHQYIPEAIANGAAGILCARPPDSDTTGVTVLMVKDVEAALMHWATFILKKYKTKVIAITGASGKSLALEALARVLSVQYEVHRADVDYPGRLALPLSLAGLSRDHQFALLELSPRHSGEMSEMLGILQPEVGIITRTGFAHQDRYNTIDSIAQEQGTLLESLPDYGVAVLNYDDDLVAELQTRSRARVLTVGMERFGADLMAYNIIVGQSSTGFDLRYGGERYVGRWTPLLGKHQLYSLLIALAVGVHYRVPIEDALKRLTELQPLPGRMKPFIGVNGSLIIDDTYSATPQSTLAALEWLQAVKEENQRVFFALGDMDTTGDAAQRGHRKVGQRAAELVYALVTQGTEASLSGRAGLDYGLPQSRVNITYTQQDVVNALLHEHRLGVGDIVLVKGGDSARMERVVSALLADAADRSSLVRQADEGEDSTTHHIGATFQPLKPCWVEVDWNAIAENVQQLKALVGPNVMLAAVVKSDAYGHGAVAVSRTALANGAGYLIVSTLSEALELREGGINAPILVLNYVPVYAVRQAIRQNITVTIYDLGLARAYNAAAREMRTRLRVHLKIDTGMGRLGVLVNDAMPFYRQLVSLQNLEVEGIYTHFADADRDEDYTAYQAAEFKKILGPLRAFGASFRFIHAANSAGTIASRDYHFSMVRVGLAMYGMHPSDKVPLPFQFKPAMTWKTVVAQVKTLPAGYPVGYARTYYTSSEETIAILPVGYADGFRRAPHTWAYVLVHGKPAVVVGRVSMEKTAINVSMLSNVAIGDEVVLMGRQGDAVLSAEDVAKFLHTSNYEVACNVLARVPRR